MTLCMALRMALRNDIEDDIEYGIEDDIEYGMCIGSRLMLYSYTFVGELFFITFTYLTVYGVHM